jgi:hypothetical protein
MEKVMENLRNDAVRGPSMGQTTLRRLLSGSTPDNQLTPDIRVGRASTLGSVSARGVSPVRNAYFRNPTEAQFRSPLDVVAKDGEDTRFRTDSSNPDGVRGREVDGHLYIDEDDGDEEGVSPTSSEDKRKHQDKGEDLGPEGDGSVYLPGDFRYIYSTTSPTQDPREGSAQNIKSAHDVPYSRRCDQATSIGETEARRHHTELSTRCDGDRSVQDEPWWRVSGNSPATPELFLNDSEKGENQCPLSRTSRGGNRNGQKPGQMITSIREDRQCHHLWPLFWHTGRQITHSR